MESRYYLLSQAFPPERFNEIVRSHWGIENRLHWSLDVVFNEDQARNRKGHCAVNLALLRKTGAESGTAGTQQGIDAGQAETGRLGQRLPVHHAYPIRQFSRAIALGCLLGSCPYVNLPPRENNDDARPSPSCLFVAPVVLLTVLMLAIAACGPDGDGPDPTPPVSMSTQPETPVTATAITVAGVVPPCTPISGASVDPCEPDVAQVSDDDGLIQLGPEPASVRWLLDGGRGRILVGHLVVRGTYIPGTVRCIADNTARYPSYTDWPNQSVPSGVSEFKCYADVRVNAYVVGLRSIHPDRPGMAVFPLVR